MKSADKEVLIVDEDSGNDFGERKYTLTIDGDMNVEEGHLLAIAGGKHSSRYQPVSYTHLTLPTNREM